MTRCLMTDGINLFHVERLWVVKVVLSVTIVTCWTVVRLLWVGTVVLSVRSSPGGL